MANAFEYFDEDINKFILLLRKVIHPYEYMNTWKRFNETLLPEKEYFYSNLNMEDITDPNYKQGKNAW